MNLNIWDIMAPAFFECLILVGIHSYLGIHVIKRKVIFVDLALAQVAALGTTVGFLFGILPDSTGAYWFSLGFAILGAAIFSLSRFRNEKIPQEAVIGLVYAVVAAVAILVIDKAPHGAEHIKELLTGSILWVKWSTIGQAALVYSGVGIFHFIFRKKFLLISNNPEEAYRQGINVRFWDFLFYVSFGIVITHSVGTAGVLLVFVFLVVPAIASIMITDVLWKQLTIGWSMGLIVSVIGLYISYAADLPSGPTVVALYGLTLLAVALILFIIRSQDRKKAAAKVVLGIAVAFIIAVGFHFLGEAFSRHYEHSAVIDPPADTVLKETSVKGQPAPLADLNKAYDSSDDTMEKLELAKKIASLNPKTGIEHLIDLLEASEFPFIRDEILRAIQPFTKNQFGYKTDGDNKSNFQALRKMRQWVQRTYK